MGFPTDFFWEPNSILHPLHFSLDLIIIFQRLNHPSSACSRYKPPAFDHVHRFSFECAQPTKSFTSLVMITSSCASTHFTCSSWRPVITFSDQSFSHPLISFLQFGSRVVGQAKVPDTSPCSVLATLLAVQLPHCFDVFFCFGCVSRRRRRGSTLTRRHHQCWNVNDLKNLGKKKPKKLQPLLPAFEEGPIHTNRGTNSKRKNHSRKKHPVLSKSSQPASQVSLSTERTPGSKSPPPALSRQILSPRSPRCRSPSTVRASSKFSKHCEHNEGCEHCDYCDREPS